ncbi:MAG: hypothetical protein IKD23_09495 [Lentisphaeria bacterium]|nr:hypothetical protein [Lentisphaeria bacterium]
MKRLLHKCRRIFYRMLSRLRKSRRIILLRALFQNWQTPEAHLFSSNFRGKIPENWEELLSDTDPGSRAAVGEFFRRIKNEWLFQRPENRYQILASRKFLAGNTLAFAGESFSFCPVIAALPDKIKSGFRNRGIIVAGRFSGDDFRSMLADYALRQIFVLQTGGECSVKRDDCCGKIEFVDCPVTEENKEKSCFSAEIPGQDEFALLKLDDLLFDRDIPIALISADCRGRGIWMLDGAAEIIERDRPVLLLTCRHDPFELLGQYTLLKNRFPFYRLSFFSVPSGNCCNLTMQAICGSLPGYENKA